MKPLLLFVLLLAVLTLPAQATKHRGLWFWGEGDSGSMWGSEYIVGTPAQENATIAFFNAQSIKRVYGSYGVRPFSEDSVIAAWNVKLHAAGIQSQSLMSGTTTVYPAGQANLLTNITVRLLNFNNAIGRTAAEKFDALHLDIEPHQLPEWDTGTPADKRNLLLLLRDTFVAVRAHFVAAGLPSFPVYADIPVTWEKLPMDGGSIGWLSAADRNQWYVDIGVPLTGVTLMAFYRSTFSNIDGSVAWERANTPGAVVRTGVAVDIGPGLTWTSVPDFNNILSATEAAYGPAGAVDIESYREWRETLAALPLIPIAAAFKKSPLAPPGTAELTFDAEPSWKYVIYYTVDLCAWQEVRRMEVSAPGAVSVPVDLRQPRGFWQVFQFQELE